ncbi:hypothetical protein D1007_20622 [Hordeum vulgare]|nr:hypothetical protein D1007_20622 [Hordeum vulgare]
MAAKDQSSRPISPPPSAIPPIPILSLPYPHPSASPPRPPSDRQNLPPPQTLATKVLVWAKTKGHHHWWPACLHSPSIHPSTESPLVSSLDTEYSDDHHPAAAVKPFLAAPDIDALARANTVLTFIATIAHARAIAVKMPLDA